MKPKLSLAGLNRLRMAIALASGAMVVGISFLGRSATGGAALVDGTLLSALWIYVGVTAVPWASLKGMPGSGVTSALTMVGFSVYLGAATAFSGWSVAEHPAWREEQRAVPANRCVPAPESAPEAPGASVANRPSLPTPVPAPPVAPLVLPTPRAAPAPTAAAPDASVRAPDPDASDTSVRAPDPMDPDGSAREVSPGDASVEEPDGRRRRSRRRRSSDDDEEPDDSRPPPSAWIERDPAGSSAPNN